MPIDFARLSELGVRNVHPVFGRGARGETLARRCHMGRTLERVRDAGVGTVVDLRTADYNDRLPRRCAAVGLAYLHVPVDARTMPPADLAAALPALFNVLDGSGFYVSCQQGLHRTDVALALHFFFHDDREAPQMVGHRTKGFLRCDDLMCRMNAMRPFFPEVADAVFAERRKRFLAFNRIGMGGQAAVPQIR